ncbi:hypothetical protein GCM10025777_23520 [Membranihabitans marinus]
MVSDYKKTDKTHTSVNKAKRKMYARITDGGDSWTLFIIEFLMMKIQIGQILLIYFNQSDNIAIELKIT